MPVGHRLWHWQIIPYHQQSSWQLSDFGVLQCVSVIASCHIRDNPLILAQILCLQCFDAVGWAAGRASGGGVLAWLSAWS